MTATQRILLNIAATYGRALFALVCGLFTGRWVLLSLGEVDYGLYGVVGGLTVFIGFLNSLLSGAVGRYYAVAVGEAKTSASGLDTCRQWFNTAVLIHTVVPLLLMLIGYPIAEMAVRHWLTIPPDRIIDCLWVLRCTCVSCFVGMVTVPFQAMYIAKQYIAELTVYSFVTTVLNVCFLYYMVSHPGDWMVRFALWASLISVAPQMIIAVRALVVFPECAFRWTYLWSGSRLLALANYAGWQFFGNMGVLLRGQGLAILVNKYFGPAVNASMTIANTVSGQASTLSGSLIGAFQPAIANAYGAGDLDGMRRLAYRACKFGTLLVLLFVIPLAAELPEVLRLWLKQPPRYAVELCWCVLAVLVIDKTAVGHMLAVNARGKIAVYQAFLGTALILTLPLAWLWVALGGGVVAVGLSLVVTMAVCAWGRVFFARKLVGMSARYWLFRIFLPLVAVSAVSGTAAWLPHLWMAPSLFRIIVATLCAEVLLLPLAWFLILDGAERRFIMDRVRALGCRLGIIRKGQP